MSLEQDFDIPFVAQLALKEKQIQQEYRPIIGVHKWFARRPGTVFRALLLSEFFGSGLEEHYYRGHDLSGLVMGVTVSRGDASCLLYGHITRILIQKLYGSWSSVASVKEKLEVARNGLKEIVSEVDVRALVDRLTQ